MKTALFECYSKGVKRFVRGKLVTDVPPGYVQDKKALEKLGYKTENIKHCEEGQGRKTTSYVLEDKNKRLYWPKNGSIFPSGLRALQSI